MPLMLGLVVLVVASKAGTTCRPIKSCNGVLQLLPRPMLAAEP